MPDNVSPDQQPSAETTGWSTPTIVDTAKNEAGGEQVDAADTPEPKFESLEDYDRRIEANRAANQAATEARRAINDEKPVTIVDPTGEKTPYQTKVAELPADQRERMHDFLDSKRDEPTPGQTQQPSEQAQGSIRRWYNRLRGRA